MKVLRKIIEIDEEKCDGCGQCVIACAEGAIAIVNGKAKLISETYCDGLGACIGECPQGAITIVEKEVEDFDPEAVEKHLKEQEHSTQVCPSSIPKTFTETNSVRNWPIKLKLVPPRAPFIKKGHLLIAADCAPAAGPGVYSRFLPDWIVLIGCPKFDNMKEYLEKLSDIFSHADIKQVTVLRMEVPCCSGLTGLVQKALENAGITAKAEEIILSANGRIVKKKPIDLRCATMAQNS